MMKGLHRIVSNDETIVAISTPFGHSGIGVIRMSGRNSSAIARSHFRPHVPLAPIVHRSAVVGKWLDGTGEQIDEVILTLFLGPHSFTGEDVVEISAHGNPLALRRIVQCVRAAGARIAEPGEFTLRAVAHGKIDLAQAEAVREFIEAQTDRQARTALSQMAGSLSNRLRPIKNHLVDVIAQLEAGIDFADDDVDVPSNASIVERLRPLRADLASLGETFGYGRILANGIRLTILGKPNVGKSSLFNRLVSAERAIVTEIPGTTRDVLTETVNVDGVPLCFADTAGIRETNDPVESIGVRRTFEAVSDTDLALVVLDGSVALDHNDRHTLEKAEAIPHLIVVNKADLPQMIDLSGFNGRPRVLLSARTGQGLDALHEALRALLLSQKINSADDLILTNVRHHETISRAVVALDAARTALGACVPHEMVLIDLYDGLAALGELTGEVVTEDILDRIFSTFCVGK
jgi:tRNA modification GTPase